MHTVFLLKGIMHLNVLSPLCAVSLLLPMGYGSEISNQKAVIGARSRDMWKGVRDM